MFHNENITKGRLEILVYIENHAAQHDWVQSVCHMLNSSFQYIKWMYTVYCQNQYKLVQTNIDINDI